MTNHTRHAYTIAATTWLTAAEADRVIRAADGNVWAATEAAKEAQRLGRGVDFAMAEARRLADSYAAAHAELRAAAGEVVGAVRERGRRLLAKVVRPWM